MIHKLNSPKANHARVLFELPADCWADRVFVVGDFNNWSPTGTPLTQAPDGAWRAMVDLPIGQQYHFHYLVNGVWHTEFQAGGGSVLNNGLPTNVINLL